MRVSTKDCIQAALEPCTPKIKGLSDLRVIWTSFDPFNQLWHGTLIATRDADHKPIFTELCLSAMRFKASNSPFSCLDVVRDMLNSGIKTLLDPRSY